MCVLRTIKQTSKKSKIYEMFYLLLLLLLLDCSGICTYVQQENKFY